MRAEKARESPGVLVEAWRDWTLSICIHIMEIHIPSCCKEAGCSDAELSGAVTVSSPRAVFSSHVGWSRVVLSVLDFE